MAISPRSSATGIAQASDHGPGAGPVPRNRHHRTSVRTAKPNKAPRAITIAKPIIRLRSSCWWQGWSIVQSPSVIESKTPEATGKPKSTAAMHPHRPETWFGLQVESRSPVSLVASSSISEVIINLTLRTIAPAWQRTSFAPFAPARSMKGKPFHAKVAKKKESREEKGKAAAPRKRRQPLTASVPPRTSRPSFASFAPSRETLFLAASERSTPRPLLLSAHPC